MTIGGLEAMIWSDEPWPTASSQDLRQLSLISIFYEGALGQMGVFYDYKEEVCPPNWILS